MATNGRIDSKQCGIVNADGCTLYVSYSTIIGITEPDGRTLFTDRKFSVTTSRHARLMMPDYAKIVPHEAFAAAVESHGYNSWYNRAPASFGK